jgi:hypothetical protein
VKRLHTRNLKDGRRHVLIELAKGEPDPTPSVNPDAFYRLNDPMDDVVAGYMIENPQRVYWDSLTQKWIEA